MQALSRRLLIRVKGGYPHHASAVSNRGLQSYTCARARIPSLSVLLALTVAALLGGTTGLGHAASPPEHWISTWAAPAVARTDQPAQTLSSATQAYPCRPPQ